MYLLLFMLMLMCSQVLASAIVSTPQTAFDPWNKRLFQRFSEHTWPMLFYI
jgi:hypothetical protein